MTNPTWGVVSTIKAPDRDILNFAAHHLDLGAHRVHIYLDEDAPEARAALIAHPKCRVILCDTEFWKRRFRNRERPEKHQQRQSANATHCYRKGPQVDWLVHIDVDEMLWPLLHPLSDQLAAVPASVLSARVRPIESLAPGEGDTGPTTHFKACARFPKERRAQTVKMYPTYGAHLNGGFLSHVTGKVFVRTGREGVALRIHNAFEGGVRDDRAFELEGTRLCHLHAPSWDQFRAAYEFRLSQGSYRSELKPTGDDGMNMNALFEMLEAEGGEMALRAFYDEVCTASGALQTRLKSKGLLYSLDLELSAKRARHFPEFA